MKKLTQEAFDDFIARLRHHNRGPGVDDHCTANPLFIVQKLRRITGIDTDYDPQFFWTDQGGEVEYDTPEEFAQALAEFVAEGGEHDDFDPDHDDEVKSGDVTLFQKIGYQEIWEYECAHFTKEAAKAFIKRKKHDHRKLRIYVESQYWCWEFNMIVQALLDGRLTFTPKLEKLAPGTPNPRD